MKQQRRVLVPGGGGYVGARLAPELLNRGYRVRIVDIFWFGEHVLDSVRGHPNLEIIKGDLRNRELVKRSLKDVTDVIHLACISNDPSADLDPQFTKSISFDAVVMLLEEAKKMPLQRFIYAGSSSVYGIKDEPNVTEDSPHKPLTLYAKYKSDTIPYVLGLEEAGIAPVVIHPGTLCGWSPRQRLDLTVNIFTHLAWRNRRITIFGGEQLRPSLTLEDQIELYLLLLEKEAEAISGKVWNVRNENYSVREMAELVASMFDDVVLVTTPTNDNRSYHTSGDKIKKELGWEPHHTIQDAVRQLRAAFDDGRIKDPSNPVYYNVKLMEKLKIR
ncbi:MAG: SDR family oxidoreductase [candidate division Zixibacteria bacterium]|nr:SDR family oxidoreductase [Candidatus Tariuqbacter arcticus]